MTRRLGVLIVAMGLAVLTAGSAAARPNGSDQRRPSADSEPVIMVVEVDGLIDPVTADLVEHSVREADARRAALLVLAIDSPGAVDVDVDGILETVRGADVPVVAWVKGNGVARRAAAFLAASADLVAMARDATVGPALPPMLDGSDGHLGEQPDAVLESMLRGNHPAGARAVAHSPLGATRARAVGFADLVAPALRDLVASLDGRRVTVDGRSITLSLGFVVRANGKTSKQVLPIRFRELGLLEQLQHALTGPFVAYLLLVAGFGLVIFEFFAIGIGLAGFSGALLVVAAFVGLAHLPVSPWGFGLLVAGLVALSVDVQAGAPRFWAAVGTGLVLAGSLLFYDGLPSLSPPVWEVVVVAVAVVVFVLPGLAAVIRSRFSTPTIGREWMVGERGVAQARFDPEGVIVVRDAPWKARSTRAATIEPGDTVEVVAVHGLVLEVQPLDD